MKLKKKHNIKCLLHSRFIFLSPEFLLQPSNFKLISMIDFGMIVLDEAHCLSEWGYDFRPHYVLIGKVTRHFKEAVVLALTATAPPHLQDDLTEMLAIQFNVIKTTMNRPNISFSILIFMMMKIKLSGCCRFYNSRDQRLSMSHRKRCV